MKAVRKIAPKCETCRFFSQVAETDGVIHADIIDGLGLCRRYAPRPGVGEHGELETDFPRVYDTDWCGEWETKRGAS